MCVCVCVCVYVVGSKFSDPTYKSRAKWKMLRGIYSAIYGEITSGNYVFQYAGGTRASNGFISFTLKSWSGWKILDPNTYIAVTTLSWNNSFLLYVVCVTLPTTNGTVVLKPIAIRPYSMAKST